tara:strand:+ start:320 stop:586 length:267 start_codon:yes stop_codon:yes gene_type:complete
MRTYKADKYLTLQQGEWKAVTNKTAKDLLLTGDYKGIDLFDDDINFIGEGLFFSPPVITAQITLQDSIKEVKNTKLEEGLNRLMNKYK